MPVPAHQHRFILATAGRSHPIHLGFIKAKALYTEGLTYAKFFTVSSIAFV